MIEQAFDVICSYGIVTLLWVQAIHFFSEGMDAMAFTYLGFGLGYLGLAFVFMNGGQA